MEYKILYLGKKHGLVKKEKEIILISGLSVDSSIERKKKIIKRTNRDCGCTEEFKTKVNIDLLNKNLYNEILED